jgi:hypothetical protein
MPVLKCSQIQADFFALGSLLALPVLGRLSRALRFEIRDIISLTPAYIIPAYKRPANTQIAART